MTALRAQHNSLPAEFLRLVGFTTLGAAILAAVCYMPAIWIGGSDSANALLLAIAVAAVGGWGGAIPVVLALRSKPAVLASAMLAGLGVRFVVTIGVALVVRAIVPISGDVLMIGVGAAQMPILAVDVWAQVHVARPAMEAAE